MNHIISSNFFDSSSRQRSRSLREATYAGNLRNCVTRRDSGTGTKGFYCAAERFRAQITADGERINLGCFSTEEEAAAAHAQAAKLHHGEFARTA